MASMYLPHKDYDLYPNVQARIAERNEATETQTAQSGNDD